MGLSETEIQSFRFTKDRIELCEDKGGKDIAVSIPKWMFNQMVEHCFGVKIAPPRDESDTKDD